MASKQLPQRPLRPLRLKKAPAIPMLNLRHPTQPLLMGIVNVTPDSFSDGGKYFDPADAVERGEKLIEEGADILDLGAESTRPGAAGVGAEEEWRRLQPVLIALRRNHPVLPISIDTGKAEVARRALADGASLINDVTGGRDVEMFPLIAKAGCPFVLMHLRGTPATMASQTDYSDGVVAGVIHELRTSAAAARLAGVKPEQIIYDPGIGFAKTAAQSVELLSALPEFVKEFGAVLLGRLAQILHPRARSRPPRSGSPAGRLHRRSAAQRRSGMRHRARPRCRRHPAGAGRVAGRARLNLHGSTEIHREKGDQ